MSPFQRRPRPTPLRFALAATLFVATAAGAQFTPTAPNCSDFEYDQKPDTANLSWNAIPKFADEEPGASGMVLEEGIVDAGGSLTALTGAAITRVRVWGYTFDFSDLAAGTVHVGEGAQTFCQTDGFTPWNITFRAASGDPELPGDLIATREVVASSFLLSTVGINAGAPCMSATTGTGCFLAGQWTFDFPPVASADVRWVGVQQQLGNNAPDGHPCVQLLLTETDTDTYDDEVFQRGGAGAAVNEDLQICVDTTDTPTLDIDDNGLIEALADGLLVLRRLFGFSDATLIANAVGGGCSRCFAGQIQNYIDALGLDIDVDNNGAVDALTDGLLILRYMFGFRDAALINGAVGTPCTECSADEIEARIGAML